MMDNATSVYYFIFNLWAKKREIVNEVCQTDDSSLLQQHGK